MQAQHVFSNVVSIRCMSTNTIIPSPSGICQTMWPAPTFSREFMFGFRFKWEGKKETGPWKSGRVILILSFPPIFFLHQNAGISVPFQVTVSQAVNYPDGGWKPGVEIRVEPATVRTGRVRGPRAQPSTRGAPRRLPAAPGFSPIPLFWVLPAIAPSRLPTHTSGWSRL